MKPHLTRTFLHRPAGFTFVPLLDERHAQSERVGKTNAKLLRNSTEELLRNRHQQTSAIAAQAVRVHAPTMRETSQRRQRPIDYLARRSRAQPRDETNSARVVVR